MENFLDVMAWIIIALCIIRVAGVSTQINSKEVKLAELHGLNPIGEALGKVIVIMVVCIVWLVTT